MFKGIFFGIFIWLVSEPTYIAPTSLRVDFHAESVDNHDENFLQDDHNTSETFANIVAEDIKQFHKNLLKWQTNKIPFYTQGDDVIHETRLKPKSANYLISFSNVSFSQLTESFLRTNIIQCDYNDNVELTIRTSPARDIKLVREIYIGKKQTPNITVTGIYTISFSSPTFRYIVKQNSSLFHQWSNIQPETKILYSPLEIELAIDSEYKSIATIYIRGLEKEIEELLRTRVTERLDNFIKQSPSFRTIFTNCMNPTRDRDFQSLERYDYVVKNIAADRSRNITINSLIINGLSNFKSIKIGGGGESFDFYLSFYDIKEYANLTYRSNANAAEKSAKWKFQAEYLNIAGLIDNTLPELRLPLVSVQLSSISLPFNDTSTQTDFANVNKNMNEIIESSMMQPIFRKYSQKKEQDQDYNSTLRPLKPSLQSPNNQSLIVY